MPMWNFLRVTSLSPVACISFTIGRPLAVPGGHFVKFLKTSVSGSVLEGGQFCPQPAPAPKRR